MSILKYILASALALSLVACGGGGGSSGLVSTTSVTSASTITSSVTATPTTPILEPTVPPVTVLAPTMKVSIVNSSNQIVNSLTAGGGFYAEAKVLDAKGNAVVNKLVTFSSSGLQVAVFSPSTAITNSSGLARVSIAPLSISTVGAATIVVTATVDAIPIMDQIDFDVRASGIPVVPILNPTLKITLINSSNVVVNSLTSSGGFFAEAKVLDARGAAVANKLVTFGLVGAQIAAFSPATAITNSSGIARVSIVPASFSTAGAATVVANADVETITVTDRTDFAVLASSAPIPTTLTPTLKLSLVNASNAVVSSIAGGGAFFAEAKLLDTRGAVVANKLVTFSLAGAPVATFSPATAITNSSGVARVSIVPASASSVGAATVVANSVVETIAVTDQSDFAVIASSLPIVTTLTPTLKVSIVNASNAVVSNISAGGGFFAEAKLLDTKGVLVVNKLVTFGLIGAPVASFSPATAITNSSGVARVSITPASISLIGAATVVASAVIETIAVSDQSDFAVSASGVSLSGISAGSSSLVSGGNTQLATTALIAGSPVNGLPVNIVYEVTCGRINGIDASSGVGVSVGVNGSGVANATYEAVTGAGNLCSGAVTVKASSGGAVPSSLSLAVASPVANAITYLGASNNKIFVSGSGALEQSVAKFKVLSTANTPLANVSVTLSIQTNPGGVGLVSTGNLSNYIAVTNSAGEVQVSVFSGTIPGPVKLRAALVSDTAVFVETQNLTVASGPPSQRFMSLSSEAFNIEGWNFDGASTKLTVRIADRQGNAVENGTVVNFTAEGGQIASSCATEQVGGISSCSVDFQSQNTRPAGGRGSVLAYLAGTKDYTDNNGNNRFDAGTDTLSLIGDAYRDDNENKQYDAGEFIVPRGGSIINCPGAGEAFPSRVNTCDQQLGTTVRQQAIVLFSSSAPSIADMNPRLVTATQIVTVSLPSGATASVSKVAYISAAIEVRSAANTLLPMPVGTKILGEVAGSDGCTVAKSFGGSVPNVSPGFDPNANLSTPFVIYMKGCYAREGNTAFFTVTSPKGLATTASVVLP